MPRRRRRKVRRRPSQQVPYLSFRRMFQRALPVMLAAFMAGCSTMQPTTVSAPLPPLAPLSAWSEHYNQLRSVHRWNAFGRLALRVDKESWNMSLQWQQVEDAFQIRLSSSFGQGMLQLDGDARQVNLRSSKGENHSAADAETLLREQLGWGRPVSGLRYWMLGHPAPDGGPYEFDIDEAGRMAWLKQGGWDARYMDYRFVGNLELPAKVFFTIDGVSVRVLVGRWELPGDD